MDKKASTRPARDSLHAAADRLYQDLLRAGATDPMVKYLAVSIKLLPVIWRDMSRETAPQRRKRRQLLANKIQKLASQIERDPEWRAAHLDGVDAVMFSNIDGLPLLTDWLRELAETVTGRATPFSLDRKQEKRSFVLTRVRAILDDGNFPLPRQRNHQAEILASAVLDDPIPSGTLAQIRKRY